MKPKFLLGFIVVILGIAYISSLSSCDYNPHRQGEWLYSQHCQSCHMADGKGLGELIPTLNESPWLTTANIHSVACLIRFGIKKPDPFDSTVVTYPMPPLYDLSETEITNILNYIGNHFGNSAGYINPVKLKEALSSCPNEEARKW